MYSSEGCSEVWREKDGTNESNKKFTTFYRDEGKQLGVRMLRTVCLKWAQGPQDQMAWNATTWSQRGIQSDK